MSYASLGCAVITQAVKDLGASRWQISEAERQSATDFLTQPNDLLKFYCDLGGLDMNFIIESTRKIQSYIQKNGIPKTKQGYELINHWAELLRAEQIRVGGIEDGDYAETQAEV